MTFSITVDGKNVEVRSGMSVLDAARRLAIDIPTLCYLEKCGPINSCLVCLVKFNGKFVPACGTKVQPGMTIESETPEVHDARRTALELLLSDHVGDCFGPCTRLCPLDLDVPTMLRHVGNGRFNDAAGVVRSALPMAGVLGRLCHHPCEQGCRRGTWDKPIPIREIERSVADMGLLAGASAYGPKCAAPTGRRVAVIGAGPTGLSAAWFLALNGHTVIVYDRNPQPGGSLRNVDSTLLPMDVLQAELELLKQVGIGFAPNTEVGRDISLDALSSEFDAILVATGEPSPQSLLPDRIVLCGSPIKINSDTYQTDRERVFAAGSVVHPVPRLVRAMAEGKTAAHCIGLALEAKPVSRPAKPFSSVMGRLERTELEVFVRFADLRARQTRQEQEPNNTLSGLTDEALRCLHCDCRALGNCDLQRYAQLYNANAARFKTTRRHFEQEYHPEGIVFERGKCILCGICVKLTELGGEKLGLTFLGRGFAARLAVPFGRPINKGLQKTMAECVKYCPTGALAFLEDSPPK